MLYTDFKNRANQWVFRGTPLRLPMSVLCDRMCRGTLLLWNDVSEPRHGRCRLNITPIVWVKLLVDNGSKLEGEKVAVKRDM